MLAANLISYAVPPLRASDSGEKALNWMSDFHVRHLPIVEDRQLLGILSEDELLNFNAPEESILENEPILLHKSVEPGQHLFEVMKLIVDTNLTIVPVLDQEQNYLGLITLENLLRHFAETGAISHPGGMLLIRMPARDYSLAEVSRLIEGENCKVLSCFISSAPTDAHLELTLKLSHQDLKHVVATLERFGYEVESFYESEYLDDLRDRYEGLMRYLNM